MEIPRVDALPNLAQEEFPTLPEIPANKFLVCSGTTWGKFEVEILAGIIITRCVEAKLWTAIGLEELRAYEHPLLSTGRMLEGVADALWTLASEGFVDIVEYEGKKYFVPKPQLVTTALANPQSLRIV